MRKVHGYQFFLIAIVVLVAAVIVVSYLGSVGVELAPRRISSCNQNPGLITQSTTICGGTYYDGIEIAGNNINVKCSGSIFAGWSNPTRANGLLINGSYTNITVEDCTFMVFPGNGVYLKGPVGGPNPQWLTKVLLKNITSYGNVEGLKVGENTYQIDVINGNFTTNFENGIHLISEYKDPVRYTVNPDLSPKYFPNDVRIFNATVSDNYKNGIHVDAEKYYRFLDDMERENNTLVFDGNTIKNNLENGIKNTDFFVAIFSIGNYYFIKGNTILNNSFAGIKIHAKKNQGPNRNEINCTLPYSANITFLAVSEVDYIYLNRIEGNKNGIELTVDSVSTNNIPNSCGTFGPSYLIYSNVVYGNRIRYNTESGILYNLMNPLPLTWNVSDFSTYIDGSYTQNIISFNGNSGVFLNGSATTTSANVWDGRQAVVSLVCNDILNNIGYGIRITGRDNPLLPERLVYLYLTNFNIIEQNSIGGIYINYTDQGYGRSFQSYYSFIGSHPLFGFYNNVIATDSSGGMRRNDFAGSPLLAFDINSIGWFFNWWSDYSPGCVDNPPDGWCDVPRPIPVANQDVQPKAGLSWGNNARGYLQLDQGILLSQCYVNIPQYPNRPGNPGGGGGNQTEPGTQGDA